MSNNGFLSRENRTSFFLNFLAVVLGIVITFGGESLLSHREEKKNLKNFLELVASELQGNKDFLNYCDTILLEEVDAALFLIKYEDDYKKAPSDSLMVYANVPLMTNEVSIYTDAFELLKSSGVLTGIKDKKLALDIFAIYGALQESAQFINLFYDHKLKYLEPALNEDVKNLLASDDVTAVGLWSKIAATKEGRQYLREIIRFLSSYDPSGVYQSVDEVILELRAHK